MSWARVCFVTWVLLMLTQDWPEEDGLFRGVAVVIAGALYGVGFEHKRKHK